MKTLLLELQPRGSCERKRDVLLYHARRAPRAIVSAAVPRIEYHRKRGTLRQRGWRSWGWRGSRLLRRRGRRLLLCRSRRLRLRGHDRNRGSSEEKSKEANGTSAAESLHDLRGYQKFPRARAARAIQFPRRIMSAVFSATMNVGAFVFPLGTCGITEASATRSPSIPRTRSEESTTAIASLPILHVPTG